MNTTAIDQLGAELAELQRLPTVSGSGGAAFARAAAWLGARLATIGATPVAVPPTSGPRVVAAERRGAGNAPTVLIYGHYDVVAATDSWAVPPFAGIQRGPFLWGRGSSDDKGPVLAGLHAVRTLSAAGRRVNLKFLYEGEEEIGSPHLPAVLAALTPWLRDVDAVLVCDTEASPDGRPTLTRGLRGELSVELTMTGVGRALHSGRYGGAAPNPAQALAMLLTSLHQPDGRVAIAGFYDGIRDPGPIPTVDQEARLRPVAAFGWGEPGRTATERTTTRPAIVVNSLCAGACRPGPWHVIPATATAKLNVRLVPGQHPDRIARRLRTHLMARSPAGVRPRLVTQAAVWPWRLTDVTHPAVRMARLAVYRHWGAEPALVRSGGSMPAVPLLAAVVPEVAMILLGFSLPSDGAHAVDEHIDLRRLHRAARTIADLLNRLGEQR